MGQDQRIYQREKAFLCGMILIFVLSIALVIWVVDVLDYAAEKHVQFGQVCHYESSMQGENWE